MYSLFALLAIALINIASAQSPWSLEGAKLTIATIDGSSRLSESFSIDKSPSTATVSQVSADEVLRLAFTIQSSSGEKLKASDLPHQVVVTLGSSSYTTTSVVSVKASSGKASWSQRIDRLPAALVRDSDEIVMRLLVASFGDAPPIELPLLKLKLIEAATPSRETQTLRERHEIRQGFRRHMERRHTFNIPAADQMPPKIISLLAAAITLFLPSATFALLLSYILPTLSFRSPSSATAPFLATLFSIEVVALLYWYGNGFTLFKMMPWPMALGIVSIFLGRSALSEMQRVRLGKQA